MGYTTRVLGWLARSAWRKAKAITILLTGLFIIPFDIAWVSVRMTFRLILGHGSEGVGEEWSRFIDRWKGMAHKYRWEILRGSGAID